MYRVAIIQNESEMMRYGWADLKPSLSNLPYSFSYFTGENVGQLFPDLALTRFDSLVLATNACNDVRVYSSFAEPENKEILQAFLLAGGGMFISFQMKLTEEERLGILPQELEISLENRPERGTSGALSIPQALSQHILFHYPHEISSKDLQNRCLNNEFVKSLYRGFAVPAEDTQYDQLLVDDSKGDNRTLLLCSRPDHPERLVVSTIPLDWQGHQPLLENVLEFITKGQPFLGLLLRGDRTVFDFRYLTANLNVSKIPFTTYLQDRLTFEPIRFGLHDTLILDPAWSLQDLLESDFSSIRSDRLGPTRLVFFDTLETGNPVISSTGGATKTRSMALAAEAWLRAQYSNGRWRGSFWQTFDVIETFKELGRSYREYGEEVLLSLTPHNIDGSYDEVLGATCAKLKLLHWFVGEEDERFAETLGWIEKRMATASRYEQATALDTLIEVQVVPATGVGEDLCYRLAGDVATLEDDVRLFRYGKTLLQAGALEAALKACRRLKSHQASSGEWLNTARTAAVVLLLMDTQRRMDTTDPLLEEMTFEGITYLKGNFQEYAGHWHDDVPATAKAMRAVLLFEDRLVYPLDEVLESLKTGAKRGRDSEVIDVALTANAALQRGLSEIRQRLSDTEGILKREHSTHALARRVSTWVSVGLVPLLTVVVFLAAYVTLQGDWAEFYTYFSTAVRTWPFLLSASLLTIPTSILYLLLRALDQIPRLGFVPEEWEAWLLSLAGVKTYTGEK